MNNEDHVHEWGELETSRFAGTTHRKCQVPDCRCILALDDEDCDLFNTLETNRGN